MGNFARAAGNVAKKVAPVALGIAGNALLPGVGGMAGAAIGNAFAGKGGGQVNPMAFMQGGGQQQGQGSPFGFNFGGGAQGAQGGGGRFNWNNIGTAIGAIGQGAGTAMAGYGAIQQARAQQAPQVAQVFDPTNPILKQNVSNTAGFLNNVQGGQNPFASYASPLQRQATGAMGNMLSQPSPQSKTLEGAAGPLQAMMNQQMPSQASQFGMAGPQLQNNFQKLDFGGGPQFQELNLGQYQVANFGQYTQPIQTQGYGVQQPGFGALGLERFSVESNPFQELQNPYANFSAMDQAGAALEAFSPIFERNLQAAQRQLTNAAPGRFSSAFVNQNQDLATKALQDYNLFAQQLGMQAMGLEQQQAAANQNFMLGARGQQTDAYKANLNARLGAQELMQTGQIQGRGLEQQLFTELQRLGLDANTAANMARIQAQQVGLQGMQAQEQLRLGAYQANTGNQLQARQLQQSAQNDWMNASLGANQQQISADQMANQFNLQNWQQQAGQFNAQQQNLLGQQSLWQQGALGAASTMGQLANNAGNFGLNAAQGAGNLALAQQQQMIDPMLALMQQSVNYGTPSDLNTIVGQNLKGLPANMAPGAGYGAPQMQPQFQMNPLLNRLLG